MESKTLRTIQVLAKIGKILSKIVFICCIVGAIGCAIGLCGTAAFGFSGLSFGGVTFKSIVSTHSEVSVYFVYAEMIVGIVSCIGEIFVAKKAVNYFKNELEDGTPFTFRGASALKKLGIYTIVIPIIVSIINAIVIAIVALYEKGLNLDKINLGIDVNLGLGIMFIVMSLVCKYGAEREEGRPTL